MPTIPVQVAPPIGPVFPRGSRLAAAAFIALRHAVTRVGRGASSPATNPVQEAQQVRELAWSYRQSDPGFAADLAAAADRHEQLHGVD